MLLFLKGRRVGIINIKDGDLIQIGAKEFSLDGLSSSQLAQLCDKIAERINHIARQEFAVAQLVSFKGRGGKQLSGVVTKVNKKTVQVKANDGQVWTLGFGVVSHCRYGQGEGE